MKSHTIHVDTSKCIGCSLCSKDCPAKNIQMVHNKANIISDACVMCAHCEAVCPNHAITVDGFDDIVLSSKEQIRLDPEDLINVLRFRKTIRQFQKRKIPQGLMDQILEAGRLTHTAKNMQDVSFLVLDKEKEHAEKIAIRFFKKIKPIGNLFSPMIKRVPIDDHFFFFHAPIVILVLAKDKTNGVLASQNMEYVAEAGGLGVLYSGFFTTCVNLLPSLRRMLQLPKGKKAAATLVLGYPAVKYLRSTPREALDVTYR